MATQCFYLFYYGLQNLRQSGQPQHRVYHLSHPYIVIRMPAIQLISTATATSLKTPNRDPDLSSRARTSPSKCKYGTRFPVGSWKGVLILEHRRGKYFDNGTVLYCTHQKNPENRTISTVLSHQAHKVVERTSHSSCTSESVSLSSNSEAIANLKAVSDSPSLNSTFLKCTSYCTSM